MLESLELLLNRFDDGLAKSWPVSSLLATAVATVL